MAKQRFRVCAHGHAVYDDSAVTCPRCGVPLRRRGDGGLARLVRRTRSASQWALSVGVLILAVGLLAVTYRLSAPLRQEVIATVGQRLADLTAPKPTATAAARPSATPTPAATAAAQVSAPLASPTPTTPPPTPTLACDLRLDYVADLTIPDGTEVKAGETVTKSWRVSNNGACAWPAGVLLQPIVNGQPEIGAGTAVAPLEAGAEGEISLQVQAPSAPGETKNTWTLCYGAVCSSDKLTMVVVVQE